ncbi:MAG: flagellar hook-associated protein FlgK [Limimaricola sp.]|uniref:flagellar hook-associated protein FlgK n=1 Tax=Limimaricola sp. TaxID=2211665 RepID=UPI001D22EA36|nr:flagellar hook-associated protein FlgK [Limimaricola sp.]MBI1417267.1 flagellar hook-associated protein FlgK [Limimaricola sp.]
MSISNTLSNALSGLTAASRMAEVVSSNLANAMTDGYGPRRVDLSARILGGTGAGVSIDGVTRMVDQRLIGDRRLATASQTAAGDTASALQHLEAIFGAADSPDSLSARIAALEKSLVAAGADPASDIALSDVAGKFGAVVSTLHDQAAGIADMREQADADIAAQVDSLNGALSQVEGLNADIARIRAGNGDTSALLDARQKAIDQVAGIVPLREIDRGNGQIALMTISGQTLLDGKAVTVGFTPTHTIVPEMTLASGALSGLTINGQPVAGGGAVGRLDGGGLGAAFALRDDRLQAAQTALDYVAADLAQRLQDPAVDPTLTLGNPGLLTDAGQTYDPANLTGLSGRITLSAAIDPQAGGSIQRLRDGLGSTGPGPAGDASILDSIRAALADPRSLVPGGEVRSAAGHAASLAAQTALQRTSAEDEASFAGARLDTLCQAELAGGVDTDQEMQNLIRIEQAYSANAKVMQTVQSMLQRLMEL